MVKDARCLACGTRLERDDVYDTYEPDDNSTVYCCIGICPKCHKTFQWEEVFTYHHYRGVEEVTGE